MILTVIPKRAAAIGQSLTRLTPSDYEAIDRAEPEWLVLERVSRLPSPWNVMTALALALSDYQLGHGGASEYWKVVSTELDEQQGIEAWTDLERLMVGIMSHPVAARLAKRKLARVQRLGSSSLVSWLGERPIDQVGEDVMELWKRLATQMGQAEDAKTISFAMKIFDLLHKISTGQYAPYPTRVPIIVDLRIARLSLSSGLVRTTDTPDTASAMTRIGDHAVQNKMTLLDGWAMVSESASASLFRIDSLAWQVSGAIYSFRHDPSAAAAASRRTMTASGVDDAVAATVSEQFTAAL